MAGSSRFLTWRIKLALVFGCLSGLALLAFDRYQASMDHSANRHPSSAQGAKVHTATINPFFPLEKTMAGQKAAQPVVGPAIDQTIPDDTEYAMFALG